MSGSIWWLRAAVALAIVTGAQPSAHAQANLNRSQIGDERLAEYAQTFADTMDAEGSNGLERLVRDCYAKAVKSSSRRDALVRCLVLDRAGQVQEAQYVRYMKERYNTDTSEHTIWSEPDYGRRMKKYSELAFGSLDAANAHLGNAGMLVFLQAMSPR